MSAMATSREGSVEPAATQADTSFSESIASSATRHHDQAGPSAAPAVASGAQTPSSTAADDRPSLNSFSSASTLESEQMFVRPSKLNGEQMKLVSNMQKSRGRTSIFVPLLFCCASIGKLVLGFGASLAVQGHYDDKQPTLIAGVILAGVGFIGCVAAALGFGAAIGSINKKKGLMFKAISISGACFIGLGYVLNQVFVSTASHGERTNIRLSFIPLTLGTALMSISLPNFCAYSELQRGRIPWVPVHRRPLVAMCFFSPWIGALFGGWVSGEHAEWHKAFNAVVLTVAISGVLAGVSIFWANHIRAKAEKYEAWMQLEEAEENLRAAAAASSHKRVNDENAQADAEKPSSTMYEHVAVPALARAP